MNKRNDEDLPEAYPLGTQVEMRAVMGTYAGGRPWTRVQRGRVTDRVFFYDLQQWGYAVQWDDSPDDHFNPGAFIIQPFLEVV